MQGIITSFRRGRKVQTDNQMIIKVDGVDNKEEAHKLVGKSVVFKTTAGKELKGQIKGVHGTKGTVRALFETGMPGQSISKKVDVQ
ncbi:MAG: 50S ribosomal protein L35ae [Candidatus Woesearchaeota archaeon]